MKAASVYWWAGKKNFGDQLSPIILRQFARINPVWSEASDAQVLSTGSILESVKLWSESWSGVVAGSGKLYGSHKVDLPNAKILGVRGPLTAPGYKLDVRSYNPVYGDPGLLADELVVVHRKTHNLGLLPHWSDTELCKRPEFLKYQPLIIDPSDDPLTVVKQIGQCRKLVSSSLHGIIVSDAFAIPRRIELPPRIKAGAEGGDYKWRDFNASVGVEHKIGVTQAASRHLVEARQHDLYDMFEKLGDYL